MEELSAITAIQEGDESALLELMSRYRDPVYRLAFRYVGNPVDAKMLTEEIFAKVYFSAGRFKPTGTVRSWIFAIAANRCRDFLRREKWSRRMASLRGQSGIEEGPEGPDALCDEGRDAAENAMERERLEEIETAIRALPERLRFPFVFCVLEDGSQEEAALIVGTSRKTIESRIYRARKVLQAALRA